MFEINKENLDFHSMSINQRVTRYFQVLKPDIVRSNYLLAGFQNYLL